MPSVAATIASSAKAAAFIPSSSKSEATFILALILPLTWIAISISSLTNALASNTGQASLNTEYLPVNRFHCSSAKWGANGAKILMKLSQTVFKKSKFLTSSLVYWRCW